MAALTAKQRAKAAANAFVGRAKPSAAAEAR